MEETQYLTDHVHSNYLLAPSGYYTLLTVVLGYAVAHRSSGFVTSACFPILKTRNIRIQNTGKVNDMINLFYHNVYVTVELIKEVDEMITLKAPV